MSQPYVGEIRMFGGNFAPAGWVFCDGRLLAISDNDVLFNLIGTTYGGDGQTTFAVPDLRGRLPIHQGTGSGLSTYTIGQSGGVENVTLTSQQIAQHGHVLYGADTLGTTQNPTGAVPAQYNKRPAGGGTGAVEPGYAPAGNTVNMAANALSGGGGNQPHENTHPFLCVSFIISLFGIFPSQN